MQTPEFSSLEHIDNEKATKARGELCHEHKRLLSRWSGRHSGALNATAMQKNRDGCHCECQVDPSLSIQVSINIFFKSLFVRFHGNITGPGHRMEHP